jgi:hypothetical protein
MSSVRGGVSTAPGARLVTAGIDRSTGQCGQTEQRREGHGKAGEPGRGADQTTLRAAQAPSAMRFGVHQALLLILVGSICR